jgi:hypothetical protein
MSEGGEVPVGGKHGAPPNLRAVPAGPVQATQDNSYREFLLPTPAVGIEGKYVGTLKLVPSRPCKNRGAKRKSAGTYYDGHPDWEVMWRPRRLRARLRLTSPRLGLPPCRHSRLVHHLSSRLSSHRSSTHRWCAAR